MKNILKFLFCFTMVVLPIRADHSPDIKNAGKYPQPYVATTRAGWLSINWNAGGSEAMPGGFPDLVNDFSNSMNLCGSGVFYTRPGWGGWYYTYLLSNMPPGAPIGGVAYLPDSHAGSLCADDSDMVATALYPDAYGGQRPFVAYMRHGWTTIHIDGFASSGAGDAYGLGPNTPQKYSAHSSLLTNIVDQHSNHMGIYFNYYSVAGMWVAVWRDGWNLAIWIPMSSVPDSVSESGFWGYIPN